MEYNKPFLIDADKEPLENHIAENSENNDFPFEFSRTNIWDQSFFSPESSNNISFDMLLSELCEIKKLISEIKNLLSDIFETKKDLD